MVAGRYLVKARLGQGGMGVVYRGQQEPLGRPVALKVLADHVAGDLQAVQRFEKEALAVARLNHPNIVTVYEFGRTEDGLLFLAMELIEGESLQQRLKRGALSASDALEVTTQTARALAEAHAQGIVHRDLKPENIMLLEGRDGDLVAKVLDFGLAKMVGPEHAAAPLTSASIIMGTPGYMSPEQIHARPLDARSDLYSLGMVWWEMLVGRPPFAGDTPIELLVKHLQQALPAPTVARPKLALSPRAERLLMRLGAKDPSERPLDGTVLLGELRALKDDSWTVDAGSGALAGASDDDWDKAFAGLGASEERSSKGDLRLTETFEPFEVPSAETLQHKAEPRATTAGGTLPFGMAPLTGPATEVDSPVVELSEEVSETPTAETAPVPPWPPPPASSLPPAAPATSWPPAQNPSPPPAATPPSAPSPASPAPTPSLSPSSPPAAVPSSSEGLKPEFDFPPRPPAPTAFRPPPDPFASNERIELGRDKGTAPAPSHYPEVRPLPGPDVRWQIRSGGAVQGPFTFAEVIALARAGTVRTSDDAAPLGEPFRPVDSYPLLMRELAARKGAPLTSRPVGAQATPLFRRVAFLGVFTAAAAAGVTYGLVPDAVDERIEQALSGLTRLGAAAGVDVVKHPLAPHFVAWRTKVASSEASATELLAEARAALKSETVKGRHEADLAFRKGLLTDPESPPLLAGFAENRAWLRAMGQPPGEIILGAVVAYARTRREEREGHGVLRASAAVGVLAGDPQQAERTLVELESRDRADPEVQLLLAFARLDRPTKAKQHAEAALRMNPGSTRAQLALGMAARRLGEHDVALHNLEARVRAEPKDALAGRELARALLEQGLLRRATRALEAAYAASGDPVTGRLFGATLLLDPAAAERAASILAEASKRAESRPEAAPLVAMRVRLLLRLGHKQQALVLAEDALRRAPRDASLQAALARAYEEAERLVEARRSFAEAESMATSREQAASLAQERGDLELRAGDRAQAREAYERSLALVPGRAGPRVALALQELERGDDEGARVALMGLLDVDPRQDLDRERVDEPFVTDAFTFYEARARQLKAKGDAVTLVVKGVTALHAGELQRARRALTAALRADRTHPVALLYAAALDLEEGDKKSAYRRLQLLEVTAPEARATQLYLALVEAEDRPEIAEARVARLQAEGRFVVESSTVQGRVEKARKRPEKAAYHFRSAFLKDPTYLPARRALARPPLPLKGD